MLDPFFTFKISGDPTQFNQEYMFLQMQRIIDNPVATIPVLTFCRSLVVKYCRCCGVLKKSF
jgi:hypothetical protein